MFFNFKFITSINIVKFVKTNFKTKPAQFFSGLVGLFCTATLLSSFFIEHVLQIQPCILCTIQRIFFLLILITCITYFIISIRSSANNTKYSFHNNLTFSWFFLFIIALFSVYLFLKDYIDKQPTLS